MPLQPQRSAGAGPPLAATMAPSGFGHRPNRSRSPDRSQPHSPAAAPRSPTQPRPRAQSRRCPCPPRSADHPAAPRATGRSDRARRRDAERHRIHAPQARRPRARSEASRRPTTGAVARAQPKSPPASRNPASDVVNDVLSDAPSQIQFSAGRRPKTAGYFQLVQRLLSSSGKAPTTRDDGRRSVASGPPGRT